MFSAIDETGVWTVNGLNIALMQSINSMILWLQQQMATKFGRFITDINKYYSMSEFILIKNQIIKIILNAHCFFEGFHGKLFMVSAIFKKCSCP